jgi:ubiquinone/menaquinone biosynthesis C-methylase UbiE
VDPFARLKEGMKIVWTLGDYRRIAEMIEPDAEALADACEIEPGMEVADVAAGTGNFAIAAARRGANVVASDITPQMVAWGAVRVVSEGLPIRWDEADAEALPYDDDRFDVVGSTFGAMFAPRPEVVARELCRIAKPGGIVAMTNWTAEGASGRLSELLTQHAPAYAGDLPPSPMRWGEPDEARRRFLEHCSSVETRTRTARFAFGSAEEAVTFFERNTGGVVALKARVPQEEYASFREEMGRQIEGALRPENGLLVLDNEYLRVLAHTL